jgi:hypothetical protein
VMEGRIKEGIEGGGKKTQTTLQQHTPRSLHSMDVCLERKPNHKSKPPAIDCTCVMLEHSNSHTQLAFRLLGSTSGAKVCSNCACALLLYPQ